MDELTQQKLLRLDYLFIYLSELRQLHQSNQANFFCHKEIAEVVREIRSILELEEEVKENG